MASVPTNSEPSTPLGAAGNESPLTLDAGLREWLTETLVSNSASNPKVGSVRGAGDRLSSACPPPWRLPFNSLTPILSGLPQQVYVKLLVSNAASGSIIGKVL